MTGKGPERKCLGCSRIRHQHEMIRMVRTPDGLVGFDLGHRLPGRGAYACPDTACLTASLKAKRLHWAFRRDTRPPTLDEALASLEGLCREKVLGLLGLAARSGSVASGREAVNRSIQEGTASLLILARDLSERTREDLRRGAGSTPCLELSGTADLGSAVGRPGHGTLAVTNGSLAQAIISQIEKSASLGLTI